MESLKRVFNMIEKFLGKPWFGKVEISIENGKIVNVRIAENIKL